MEQLQRTNDMKQEDSRRDGGGCCNQHSCTKEELMQYRQDVKTRIAENDGTIFPNNCPDKTEIVLQEFIRAAKERVCIYCGHLNAAVYGDLQSDFEDAIARGVEVRVICAPGEIGAKELAEKLKSGDHFRILNEAVTVSHFAVVDGLRYRIETDQDSKDAFVCAYAGEEQQPRVRIIEGVHDILWDMAS